MHYVKKMGLYICACIYVSNAFIYTWYIIWIDVLYINVLNVFRM